MDQELVVQGLRSWGITVPEMKPLGRGQFALKDGRIARLSLGSRPLEEVRREARALGRLAGRAPAPVVVRTHHDDDFAVAGDRALSLFVAPEGAPRKGRLPAEDCFSAGRLLGKLHAVWRAPREMVIDVHTRLRALDLGGLAVPLGEVNKKLAAKLVTLPEVAARVVPDEPRVGGFVHGNFRPDNVLFRNNSATGVVGFERARPGDVIGELAYALYAFAGDHNNERFGAFLAGYDVSFSLTRARTLRPRYALEASVMLLEDHARGVATFDEADLDPLRELLS